MAKDIRWSLNQMSLMISEMVKLVYQGLMQNDAHFLDRALNKENIIDDLEKEVMNSIVKSKGADKKDTEEIVILAQIAQNLERMGDELRSLIERIEIKIAEKLLFSDIGIKQYEEVFLKMQESVDMTVKLLSEDKNELLDPILENGDKIRLLIQRYRKEYLERFAKDIEPRAVNIFFDMLDFTGNIARHCSGIARIQKEK